MIAARWGRAPKPSARYGSIADAKTKLGDIAAIKAAFVDMQRELYTD